MKFNHPLYAAPLTAMLATAAPLPSKRAVNILDGQSVATWWGQETTTQHTLAEVCSDSAFDIVMLAQITKLTPAGLNLAGHIGGVSKAQEAAGMKDLCDGTVAPKGATSIAEQIKGCQDKGKKVLISFGGDAKLTDPTFSSDKDAEDAAVQLWDLFLGGRSPDAKVEAARPFGDVTLDGVDLDNETGRSAFYDTFVKKLREMMGGDKGRTYLIGASPQVSDLSKATGSIPDSIYPHLDFLNVQFYNNPQDAGQLGGPDFLNRVGEWNDKIKSKNPKAKLMVGAPASNKAATGKNVGVRSAADIAKDLAGVKGRNFSQLGGVSMWSAGYAMDNGNWQQAVKKALTGTTGGVDAKDNSAPAAVQSATAGAFGGLNAASKMFS